MAASRSPPLARPLALVGLLLLGAAPARGSEPARLDLSARGELVGVVVATRSLDLTPKVEGRLEALRVRLGERVAAGQELAVLERQPLELELASRQASLQAAKAEQARSEILLTQARQRLEREQRVREHSAAEALESAENQVALALADLELARARTAQAQAQHDLAARSLENTRVRAPFAGTVAELFTQPGMQVSQATALLRLVGEELRLRFAVPAAQAGAVRAGTQVEVRLEALALELTGVVESLAPEVDPASRHLRAEARLDIPPAWRSRIPTGLLAQVRLRPAGQATASDP